MQANWSLILNVLLLIGVIITISRLMKARKQNTALDGFKPSDVGHSQKANEAQSYHDDIIAVRKVNQEADLVESWKGDSPSPAHKKPVNMTKQPQLMPQVEIHNTMEESSYRKEVPSTIMFFILAKENRQFAGYELLQTVLAAGLRFGEGHLFHRHQSDNGQGPVLCSLAAATSTGVFDLQNIGAFSVRGLCLFMQTSNNPGIDEERFTIMLDTARQLKEGLDAFLLDEKKKPLTNETISDYFQLFRSEPSVQECESLL